MDFALPEIGEGVYEAELVRWLVRPGESVKRGQGLLEVLTDKATMEVPSPFVGTVTELKVNEGQRIKVGDMVLAYRPAEAPEPVPSVLEPAHRERTTAAVAPAAVSVGARGNNGSGDLPVKAAPSVRHMARQLGIDLRSIQGSGPQGRILVEDLTSQMKARTAPVGGNGGLARPEPKPDYGRPGTRIKLQGLRRRIAEHMVRSVQTIPHYSYIDECDVTELVRLRTSLKEAYSRAGVKLTYLPFFVKAVVAALKEVPLVNSSLNEDDGEIVLHDRYHIGIAVSTGAGLLVPVIHDADRKDIGTLARDIDRLSSEARSGRARLEDLRGGTFTITSVGNLGGLISTPIINHPEVGIVGIGKVVKRPMFDEMREVRAADMVYLSFSFDHRVVDGAVGAVFGNTVLRHLHNPALLLLPEKI
jgi:pyruvate dehydrogenase E2 component (dihydrolipoamide acetyltransferase)/2-oxoisovalerate dehydrogenase E2 component (dihydrolipoyl transacylase)